MFGSLLADLCFPPVLMCYATHPHPHLQKQALEIAARMAESNASLQRDVRISHSIIPDDFGEEEAEEQAQEEEARAGRAGVSRVAGFMGS